MRFSPTGPRLPRAVRLLIVARTVNRLGAFSLPFLTVLITTRFGASAGTAGLVSAAFGLATIPSRLAGGRLADTLGRRRTMITGLSGCAVAQLGIAAADSLASAACFAVLLGLAFELYEPPSQAMIADAVGTGERVRAYSLLNAALAVAGMGAGLIAAGLGRWDLRWLFVADAVTCVICAAVVYAVLPADRPSTADHIRGKASGVRPWRDRALLALLAPGTLFALVYLQIMITLPLSLAHRDLQPADAGLLLAVSAVTIVLGQPLLRLKRLAALPAPAAFAAGYALLALGLSGYAAAHTLQAFFAATLVWSLGDLLLVGRMYAVVADLAPDGGTGRYMAVYGTSWGLAGIAAPVTGTQLLQHAGATALWSTMAAVCLALAAVQPGLARMAANRTRPAAGTAPPAPESDAHGHRTAPPGGRRRRSHRE